MTLLPFRSDCMDPELMILASTVPVALPACRGRAWIWLLRLDRRVLVCPSPRRRRQLNLKKDLRSF